MSIMTFSPAHVTSGHPAWCSSEHCEADTPISRHSSVPSRTRLSEDDTEIRISVARNDDRAVDGTLLGFRHAVHVEMENIESVCHCGRDLIADGHLTADEADQLSIALATYAAQVRSAERAVA